MDYTQFGAIHTKGTHPCSKFKQGPATRYLLFCIEMRVSRNSSSLIGKVMRKMKSA